VAGRDDDDNDDDYDDGLVTSFGPSTWNELPLTLRLLPWNNISSFCKLLETIFGRSWTE